MTVGMCLVGNDERMRKDIFRDNPAATMYVTKKKYWCG